MTHPGESDFELLPRCSENPSRVCRAQGRGACSTCVARHHNVNLCLLERQRSRLGLTQEEFYRRLQAGEFDAAPPEPTQAGGSEPTPDEARAIASLERLARRWPDTLYLASMAGALCVMRKGPDGGHAMIPGELGGLDQEYSLATIHIDNTGGDW